MVQKMHRCIHTMLSPAHALLGTLVQQLRFDAKLGYPVSELDHISVQLAQSRHATVCAWPWKHALTLGPSEMLGFISLGAWNPLRFFLILQESHRLFMVTQE